MKKGAALENLDSSYSVFRIHGMITTSPAQPSCGSPDRGSA